MQRSCRRRAGGDAVAGRALAMPVVWSEACLLHEPGGEAWLGVRGRAD